MYFLCFEFSGHIVLFQNIYLRKMYVSYFHRYRSMRESKTEEQRERREVIIIKIAKLIAKLEENNLKLPKLSRQ